MLTFFPEFESSFENLDVLFFIDASNSMKGELKELKKLVLLAYHLLPENVKFNMVAFGDG